MRSAATARKVRLCMMSPPALAALAEKDLVAGFAGTAGFRRSCSGGLPNFRRQAAGLVASKQREDGPNVPVRAVSIYFPYC